MPSPGRGSPPPRRSSPAGTRPPAAWTTPATQMGTGTGAVVLLRALPPAGQAARRRRGLLRRRCWRPDGIHWQAITDPAQRRDLVLQVLAQVPVLWVWDNVEPVTGFPPGTAQRLDPGRAGRAGGLPARPGPAAPGARCCSPPAATSRPGSAGCPPACSCRRCRCASGCSWPPRSPPATAIRLLEADWRPLLRFTAGNPLTITVLVGQALRENLTTTEQIEAFVARLRAGEAELEPGEDAALGRTRSLAASLSYGFTHAFTDGRARPARGAAPVPRHRRRRRPPRHGRPDIAGDDAVPELAGLTRDTAIALLDRAADIGLLSPLGGGYYAIHPALPWYFTTLYTATYGQPGDPAAQRAARAYTHALAALGNYYQDQDSTGAGDPVPALRAEEANLQHALALARQAQHWDDVTPLPAGPARPVSADRAGRGMGPARRRHHPRLHRPGHRRPAARPRRPLEPHHRIPGPARPWPRGTGLPPPASSTPASPGTGTRPPPPWPPPTISSPRLQRIQLRSLAVSLQDLGHILRGPG